MDNDLFFAEVKTNKKAFQTLEKLCGKSIKLNSIGVKILGIHFMENSNDWHVIKHKHTYFEYHYVIKGQVYTKLDGCEYKVVKGESYVIPAGMYHSHDQKDGIGHIGIALCFEFTNKTVETNELIGDLVGAAYPVISDQKICEIFVELLNLTKLHGSEIELQLLIMRLILNIGKTSASENIQVLKRDKCLHHQLIAEQAIRFIEENFKEDILVEDVATAVYLSHSQLARIFKKYIGETVNHYINQYRMDKAKLLLKGTDKEIKSIAGEVGFNSEYYFSNAFKQHMGVSPSFYRTGSRV